MRALWVGGVPTCVGDFITVMNKGVHVPVVGKKGGPHMLTHLSQIVRFFILCSSKQMLSPHLNYAVMVIN